MASRRMRREASNGGSAPCGRGRASRWDSSRTLLDMRSPSPSSSRPSRRRRATSARGRHSSVSEDMVLESVGNEKPWAVDRERRPYGMRVVLPKRTYVLPWTQFLYAEGAPDTVRAVFSMRDVLVSGCGLEALLADFAAQVVTVLQQPPRVDNFLRAPGPRVLAVEVRRIEGSGPS